MPSKEEILEPYRPPLPVPFAVSRPQRAAEAHMQNMAMAAVDKFIWTGTFENNIKINVQASCYHKNTFATPYLMSYTISMSMCGRSFR